MNLARQYLKKEKENKDLDGYLQKYFNFSSRELSFQKHLIDLNKTFFNELALSFGWDKRTCKKFGADYKDLPKPKKIKEKPKPTGPSLFDF